MESLVFLLFFTMETTIPRWRTYRWRFQLRLPSKDGLRSTRHNFIGLKYLTQICSVVLLKGYLPEQWEIAQIILIWRPGDPLHELTSCRPTRLLNIVSKIFERLLKMAEDN
jgi:hypothetical protein